MIYPTPTQPTRCPQTTRKPNMNTTALNYKSAGVDYAKIDPLKVLAQQAASSTAVNLAQHGLTEVQASRGESAYVLDVGDFYLASITECLGTKALVADAMRAITGKTYYAAIAQDTLAMAINDIITVGATPVSAHAYWAAGGDEWFADQATRSRPGERLEGRLRCLRRQLGWRRNPKLEWRGGARAH